jgi:hypothetical protein
MILSAVRLFPDKQARAYQSAGHPLIYRIFRQVKRMDRPVVAVNAIHRAVLAFFQFHLLTFISENKLHRFPLSSV